MRLRGGVQVVQLALTVVLLAGAGLMVRSISHLYRVPLGFDADRLLTVRSQLVRGEPSRATWACGRPATRLDR